MHTSSFSLRPRPPASTLVPYTTLFRSRARGGLRADRAAADRRSAGRAFAGLHAGVNVDLQPERSADRAGRKRLGRLSRLQDRKSTRLNSSHLVISYAVFCLKKKMKKT